MQSLRWLGPQLVKIAEGCLTDNTSSSAGEDPPHQGQPGARRVRVPKYEHVYFVDHQARFPARKPTTGKQAKYDGYFPGFYLDRSSLARSPHR